MQYSFGILRQDRSPEADKHNGGWLGPETLGIEVTTDVLAEQCQLGNIDPQHNARGESSAIEESLRCPLPPEGSKLVTIRPDKDSIGAMAVLLLRANGREDSIDKMLVSWVGALDRHGFEGAREHCPELAYFFPRDTETRAMNVICLNREPWPDLSDKVREVGKILCREASGEDLRIICSRHPKRKISDFKVEMQGQFVAFVEAEGMYDQARDWANQRYPIAVIFDPSHDTPAGLTARWSIIRQNGHFDRMAFEAAINAAESIARKVPLIELRNQSLLWGGPLNIISSPKGYGRGTILSKKQILKIVLDHVRPVGH